MNLFKPTNVKVRSMVYIILNLHCTLIVYKSKYLPTCTLVFKKKLINQDTCTLYVPVYKKIKCLLINELFYL